MLRIIFSLFFVLFLGVSAALLYYYNQVRFEADKVIYYEPALTTEIFDRNGKKLANIFGKEHRFYATFDEIPSRVIEALVAIEDTVFFEHSGINIDAIFRAIVKDIKAGKLVEGASTITQQLVKNTLLTREKKFSRKLKEVLLALRLDSMLSKEQILERYLNHIFFGRGYYGIKTAADGYFHKSLDKLTLKEIAMLVGLPKAPSYYAPTKNYEASLKRANRVITRMHDLGWIDDETFFTSLDERPKVYKESRTQNKAPFIIDEVIKRLSKRYHNFRTGGYKVYTTIDLEMQNLAKVSLNHAYDKALVRIAKKDKDVNQTELDKLNGAIVVQDIQKGDILALVGGVNYKKSSFNRAVMSRRQPGSSFKPFLFQVALDNGYSGVSKLTDIARTYNYELNGQEKKWQPKNYEKDYKGLIDLREAMIHSRNLATINLLSDLGLNNVYKELTRYGFEDIPYNLSISLGSFGISPLKLSELYTIISNNGVKSQARLISRVEDFFGKYEEFLPVHTYITKPEQAFLMKDILHDTVKRGTGRRAKVAGIELAGKTGTTNSAVDAWFCGFSPTVQTLVWFGYDDNTPMKRGETGGRVAAPAFAKFYEGLLKIKPQIKRRFDVPEGVVKSVFNGKTEYFTDTSRAPVEVETNHDKDKLIF